MPPWVNSALQQSIVNTMIESKGDSTVLANALNKTKCNINAYDMQGYALIHWTARYGYTNCIEVLMEHGADITLPTLGNKTVYEIAVEFGNTATAEWVRFTMDEVNEFFKAVVTNDTVLLKKCLSEKSCIYFKNRHGMSGLHVACQKGTHECISFLVENGFNVNEQDFFGRTPLHWACINVDIPLINYLIQNGGDVTIASLTHKTPVHLCFSFMPFLNNPEIESHYQSAFFDAIQRYDRESLRAFFHFKSNEYAAGLRNEQGCSALHIAVKAGMSDLVKELLDRGFDKYLKDNNNVTPYDLGVSSKDRIKEYLGIDGKQDVPEVISKPSNHIVDTNLQLTQESSQSLHFPQEDKPSKPISLLPVLQPLEPTKSLEPKEPIESKESGTSTGMKPVDPLISPIQPPSPPPLPKEVPILSAPTPSSSRPASVQLVPPITLENRTSTTEPEMLEKQQSGDMSDSTDLSECKTIDELLDRTGMQEYKEDFAKLNCVSIHDLFELNEEELKEFMKFGHRKKLLEIRRQIDPLYSFLTDISHLEYYNNFKELGFDSIWSIMGITKDCQEKLGLSSEAMNELLEKKEAFGENNKPDVDNCRELMDLKEESNSKPILTMLFSDETADRLIKECALENVGFLKFVALENVDELGLKYGEAIGLCYLVSIIKSKMA